MFQENQGRVMKIPSNIFKCLSPPPPARNNDPFRRYKENYENTSDFQLSNDIVNNCTTDLI